jgi:glycosyltransferase involved in cell wall biosynthesis
LKILHLSNEGLPDWRVEKAARSAKNRGFSVDFAGSSPKNWYCNTTFSHIYEVNWTAKARYGLPLYWNEVRKQVDYVLRQARPDIVHAHNIFSAKMMSEFDIPFVYDDHEYWSQHSLVLNEMSETAIQNRCELELNNSVRSKTARFILKMKVKPLRFHLIRLWTDWEKELVSSGVPVITVSEEISHSLAGHEPCHSLVFVVPNYPSILEVPEDFQPQFHPMLTSIYSGSDGLGKIKYPSRNIDGLVETFYTSEIGRLTIIGWSGNSSEKVCYTGFLPRKEMFFEMQKASIGLLPWRRHWSHFFVNPNKVYEYAHAGLFVMCTSSFTTVAETFKGKCALFDDYDDMVEQLNFFKDYGEELYKKRLALFRFARNNLFWEKIEHNIFRAYQLS